MKLHRWLWLGLGCVLCLRLIYVLSIPNSIDYWRDGLSYENIARNLVLGIGYWDTTGEWPGDPPYADPTAPTLRWLPGYPLFIAGVYTLFGQNYRAVYIIQTVLAIIIALLIYLIGTIVLDERVGIVAAFLYAIDPFAIYLCGHFQTEQLFTVLIVTSLYCFLKMRKQVAKRPALLFGLSMGTAALTRSIAGVMFAVLCVEMLVRSENGVGRSRLTDRIFVLAIASVTFLGTLSPWLIRNYRLTGRYVLTTEAWQALAMANNDDGGAHWATKSLAGMPQLSIVQSELEREEIYKEFVIDWIANHPSRFAGFYLWRLGAFWSPSTQAMSGAIGLVAFVFTSLLYLFGAVYAIISRERWHELLPIYMTLLTFMFAYAAALVITRFRLPLYPLLEIVAAAGVILISQRVLRQFNQWQPARNELQ